MNTAILPNGKPTNISGTAIAPFPGEPGHLMVSFPGSKLFSFVYSMNIVLKTSFLSWKSIKGPPGGYRVLDTDYTSFACVYECVSAGVFKFEFGWILARNNVLSEQELNRAYDVFKKYGIDIGKFVPTKQGDDCNYTL